MPRPTATSSAQLVALAVTAWLIAGCSDCTGSEAASVCVEVLDADGQPVTADAIRYRIDGGDERSLECGAFASCCVLNGEQSGRYELTAVYAGQVQTRAVRVEDGDDDCHVDTETVVFAMDATVAP